MLTASQEWNSYRNECLDRVVEQLAEYYVNNPDPDLLPVLDDLVRTVAFGRAPEDEARITALGRLARQEAEDTLRSWAKQRIAKRAGGEPCSTESATTGA